MEPSFFLFVLRMRERDGERQRWKMCWCDSVANSSLNLTPLLWLRQSKELVACGVSIWGWREFTPSPRNCEWWEVLAAGAELAGWLVVWVQEDGVFLHRGPSAEECAPHKGMPKPWGFLHFGCDGRYSSLLRAFLLTSLQTRQMCGYLLVVTPGRKYYWIS